jgi:hypothetical protein
MTEVVMNRDVVVYRRRGRWVAWRRGVERLEDLLRRAARPVLRVLVGALGLALLLARAILVALMLLFEPLLRLVVLPLAFGFFLTALLFGVLLHARHFPTWGMLALSVGLMWVYGVYIAVLVWLMGGRRG